MPKVKIVKWKTPVALPLRCSSSVRPSPLLKTLCKHLEWCLCADLPVVPGLAVLGSCWLNLCLILILIQRQDVLLAKSPETCRLIRVSIPRLTHTESQLLTDYRWDGNFLKLKERS